MIRQMSLDDYDRVYALWVRTAGMGLREEDDSRDGIVRYLKRNPETCFVAEIDGEIMGVILSGHDGRRGYIYHLAVDSSVRKKGMGKALADKALDALRQQGIRKTALVVFKNNTLGNSFWSAIGFEERCDLIYRNKRND